MKGTVKITQATSVKSAVVGDKIRYAIKIRNDTDEIMEQLKVVVFLEEDLEFILGSVAIDGLRQRDVNVLEGVEIERMGMETTQLITFEAKVISRNKIKVESYVQVSFNYLDVEEGLFKWGSETSNPCEITLESAELKMSQKADQTQVGIGDVIRYRIILSNLGSIQIRNIILRVKETPSGKIIKNSIRIRGESSTQADFIKGIALGTLDIKREVVVEYEVQVTGGSCLGVLNNEVYATYQYLMENNRIGTMTTECVNLEIPVYTATFKQISMDKCMEVPLEQPPIEEIDDVELEMMIEDRYVIHTMKGVSHEGQVLSGYKLMVHGRIKWCIEYTALMPHQPMYTWNGEQLFSQFIVLPPDYVDGPEIQINSKIENVEIDLLESREVLLSIIFRLDAQIGL